MNEQEMNDVAKEVSVILEYVEPEILKKIPSNIIEYLKNLSIESDKEFEFELGKKLNEQNILEESKDLMALIFYLYIANENEKREIMNSWNYNENQYQEMLKEKYQINFKKAEEKVEKIEEKSLIIKKEKGSLFSKIKEFINRIFLRERT